MTNAFYFLVFGTPFAHRIATPSHSSPICFFWLSFYVFSIDEMNEIWMAEENKYNIVKYPLISSISFFTKETHNCWGISIRRKRRWNQFLSAINIRLSLKTVCKRVSAMELNGMMKERGRDQMNKMKRKTNLFFNQSSLSNHKNSIALFAVFLLFFFNVLSTFFADNFESINPIKNVVTNIFTAFGNFKLIWIIIINAKVVIFFYMYVYSWIHGTYLTILIKIQLSVHIKIFNNPMFQSDYLVYLVTLIIKCKKTNDFHSENKNIIIWFCLYVPLLINPSKT